MGKAGNMAGGGMKINGLRVEKRVRPDASVKAGDFVSIGYGVFPYEASEFDSKHLSGSLAHLGDGKFLYAYLLDSQAFVCIIDANGLEVTCSVPVIVEGSSDLPVYSVSIAAVSENDAVLSLVRKRSTTNNNADIFVKKISISENVITAGVSVMCYQGVNSGKWDQKICKIEDGYAMVAMRASFTISGAGAQRLCGFIVDARSGDVSVGAVGVINSNAGDAVGSIVKSVGNRIHVAYGMNVSGASHPYIVDGTYALPSTINSSGAYSIDTSWGFPIVAINGSKTCVAVIWRKGQYAGYINSYLVEPPYGNLAYKAQYNLGSLDQNYYQYASIDLAFISDTELVAVFIKNNNVAVQLNLKIDPVSGVITQLGMSNIASGASPFILTGTIDNARNLVVANIGEGNSIAVDVEAGDFVGPYTGEAYGVALGNGTGSNKESVDVVIPA